MATEMDKLAVKFAAHAKADAEFQSEILKTLKDINDKLDPMTNTYNTVNTLGRWLMPLLVAASLIVGMVWVIIQIVFRTHTP